MNTLSAAPLEPEMLIWLVEGKLSQTVHTGLYQCIDLLIDLLLQRVPKNLPFNEDRTG